MDAMTPSLLRFGEHGCRWCNEDWWSSPWSGLQDEDLEFAVFGQTICHHIAGGTTYERSLLSSSLQFMTQCRATCLRRRYNRRYGMGVGRHVRRSLQRSVRRRRREVLETSCRGPWRRYLLAQTQGNPRSLYPRKTVTGTLVENYQHPLRIGMGVSSSSLGFLVRSWRDWSFKYLYRCAQWHCAHQKDCIRTSAHWVGLGCGTGGVLDRGRGLGDLPMDSEFHDPARVLRYTVIVSIRRVWSAPLSKWTLLSWPRSSQADGDCIAASVSAAHRKRGLHSNGFRSRAERYARVCGDVGRPDQRSKIYSTRMFL